MDIEYEGKKSNKEPGVGKGLHKSLECALDYYFGEEAVVMQCPRCMKNTEFLTTTKISAVPEVLVVQLNRFGDTGGKLVIYMQAKYL